MVPLQGLGHVGEPGDVMEGVVGQGVYCPIIWMGLHGRQRTPAFGGGGLHSPGSFSPAGWSSVKRLGNNTSS